MTAAQWLAELMCERRAAQERRKLALRFWDAEPDASFFMQQMRCANKLLKRYGVEQILAALNDPDGAACYSLSAPWLAPILARVSADSPGAAELVDEQLPARPRLEYRNSSAAHPRESTLSRLRKRTDGQKS